MPFVSLPGFIENKSGYRDNLGDSVISMSIVLGLFIIELCPFFDFKLGTDMLAFDPQHSCFIFLCLTKVVNFELVKKKVW